MRRDVQSQFDQTCKDSQHREEEIRTQLDEVAAGLGRLTKQLNNFKPVSKNVAGEREQRISTKVDEQLQMHSAHIESLNQSVGTTQQKAADHTGILQDLLVGLENMGENMKRFREEME